MAVNIKEKTKYGNTIYAGELDYDKSGFPSFQRYGVSDRLAIETEIENFLLTPTIINLLKRLVIEKKQEISLTKQFKIEEQYFTLQIDEINYAIDFDSDYDNWPCRKLMLQPFVENSIIHGFEGMSFKKSWIIL